MTSAVPRFYRPPSLREAKGPNQCRNMPCSGLDLVHFSGRIPALAVIRWMRRIMLLCYEKVMAAGSTASPGELDILSSIVYCI
jgi:hypothetical protein